MKPFHSKLVIKLRAALVGCLAKPNLYRHSAPFDPGLLFCVGPASFGETRKPLPTHGGAASSLVRYPFDSTKCLLVDSTQCLRGAPISKRLRLLVSILVLFLLVVIDLTQLRGHYTAEAARLLKYSLAQLGL